MEWRRTEKMNKKKIGLVDILQLQGAVVVYSLSTVAGKLASDYEFLSFKYILFFGLELVILAVYAIIWQQMIKKFQLSIACANKALTLMWSMLWNFLIFSTGITVWKVVGVALVIIGVVIMNSDEDSSESADCVVASDGVSGGNCVDAANDGYDDNGVCEVTAREEDDNV
jgi:drug/metabolite transporter (DMT)-like permease